MDERLDKMQPENAAHYSFSAHALVIRDVTERETRLAAGDLYDNAPKHLAVPSGQRLRASLEGWAEPEISALELGSGPIKFVVSRPIV